MLNRLLSTVITLAVLASGATIGLEAAGLLFNAGKTEQEQRAEAFLAQAEASLEAKDVPGEPVEETPAQVTARSRPAPLSRVVELNKVAAALLAARPHEDQVPAPVLVTEGNTAAAAAAVPAIADDRPPPSAAAEPAAAAPEPITTIAAAPAAPAGGPCVEDCATSPEPKQLPQPATRHTVQRARARRLAARPRAVAPAAEGPAFELTVNLP